MTNQANGADGWSVVMTGWSGDWSKFGEVAEQVFGRRGLDTFSLTLGAEDNLPAELAEGLSQEQALAIAQQLREAGAGIDVVMTRNLVDCRHRVSEIWADKCTDNYHFSEIEGIITILSALNARKNLAYLQARSPEALNWALECSMNHIHVGLGELSSAQIEEGIQVVESLITALQTDYPDRSFTISHSSEIVSFWQTTSDSPKGEYYYADSEGERDTVWCQNCSKMRKFNIISKVDSRFSEWQWGVCTECGEECLIYAPEKLTYIHPE